MTMSSGGPRPALRRLRPSASQLETRSGGDGASVHVVIFASHFEPAYLAGGPARTLASLVDAIPRPFVASVITSNRDLGSLEEMKVGADQWLPRGRHRVYYASKPLSSTLNAIRQVLRERPSIVYINSFFAARSSILPQLILRFVRFRGVTLLAPRGELSPGALAIRPLKKRAYLALYRALSMGRRVVWHASAERERDEIRSTLPGAARIVVRENESPLPERARRNRAIPGPLRAVFLSRVVPKKGLDIALAALADVARPLVLDVYGSLEDRRYVERCKRLVDQVPPHVSVTLHGAISPESIPDMLAKHDLMLFPTHGENFGHVISEALAQSVPVLVPDTTPWTPSIRAGGGEIVSSTPIGEWTRAIDRWATLSEDERTERRALAGAVFDEWRRQPRQLHVLELAASFSCASADGTNNQGAI